MLNKEENNKPLKKKHNTKLLLVNIEKNKLSKERQKILDGFEILEADNHSYAIQKFQSGTSVDIVIYFDRREGKCYEFLSRTQKLNSKTIPVIISEKTDSTDVKNCVDSRLVFFVLSAAAGDNEFQQAVLSAFENYKSNLKSRKLSNEVKNLNDRISGIMDSFMELYPDTIRVISGLINKREKYFFVNPFRYISLIAKSTADLIKTDEESKKIITESIFLYQLVLRCLPEKFVLVEPYDIEDVEESIDFFEKYNELLDVLLSQKSYQPHARIISQLWENFDGSGLPNGVPGSQLSKSSQIIKIALSYVFHTYGLTPDFHKTLQEHGEVIQTAMATKSRREKAINLIFKRIKWFDYDVFQAFQEIWKQKNCPALNPVKYDLIIQTYQKTSGNASPAVEEENEEEDQLKSSDTITYDPDGKKGPKLVEKEIKVEHLKPGMVTGQNVVTKKGILVVRQDNHLTAKLVENIRQLESNGMLSSYITIMVPKE